MGGAEANPPAKVDSAALKRPREVLRIRPEIFNVDPDLGLKLRQTKQHIWHGTHKPAHSDSERFWADFGVFRRRSETLNCEIAQPRGGLRPPPFLTSTIYDFCGLEDNSSMGWGAFSGSPSLDAL